MKKPGKYNELPFLVLSRNGVKTPLSMQIYRQIREAILRGKLKAGSILPSTRTLARALAISRNTAILAYEQLSTEGFINGTTGSGSRVADIEQDSPVTISGKKKEGKKFIPHLSKRAASGSAKLSTSLLRDSAPRPFRLGTPVMDKKSLKAWANLVSAKCRNLRIMQLMYNNTQGYLPLRQAISRYVGTFRGISCDPGQIVITSGAQQALQLTSFILTDPGDGIYLEEPGYIAAREAFLSVGARIIQLPVDNEGAAIPNGKASKRSLLYVTPSHQYPLGVTMSIARRLGLLEWAQLNNAVIIEDDYNSEYRYNVRPIEPLQSLDKHDCVIYIGSFSKVMFPALRIGYAILPKALVSPFVYARSLSGVHSFSPEQAALAEFIDDGHLERHIRRMRELYRIRKEALEKAVHIHLKNKATVLESHAGMHSVVTIDNKLDDIAIAQQAKESGIELTALSRYFLHGKKLKGFLMGFSGFSPEELEASVKRLGEILSLH